VNFVDKWKEVQSRENSKIFFRSYNAANKPQFWSGKNNALVQGYPTIIKYKKKGNGKFVVSETFGGNRGNVDELVAFAMKGIGSIGSRPLTIKSITPIKTPKPSKKPKKELGAPNKSRSRSRAKSRGRK
jgi:hypothetical protein